MLFFAVFVWHYIFTTPCLQYKEQFYNPTILSETNICIAPGQLLYTYYSIGPYFCNRILWKCHRIGDMNFPNYEIPDPKLIIRPKCTICDVNVNVKLQLQQLRTTVNDELNSKLRPSEIPVIGSVSQFVVIERALRQFGTVY